MPNIHNLQSNASALALWARRIGIVDAPTSLNIVNYADVAGNASGGLTTSGNTFYLCPLTLSTADGSLSMQLPVDPVISVSGSNSIAQRQVAQSTMRGTIKEFWNADDYKVDIKSVLIGEDPDELSQMLSTLRALLDRPEALLCVCPLLQEAFGISRLVVQSYQFPATKGLRNQQFSLSCLSDEAYTLIEEI
ncbi:MAG: hypothetical protein KBT04_05850 [Bacteroidales bacterium]|nr:hypothetical protein [Candidatus Colimorpha onthohippi]